MHDIDSHTKYVEVPNGIIKLENCDVTSYIKFCSSDTPVNGIFRVRTH